jgi:hypothetical protein
VSEEISRTELYRSRRVRPLTREDREENEERFSKKLAELVDLDQEKPGHHKEGEPEQQDRRQPDQPPTHMGRHLDIET